MLFVVLVLSPPWRTVLVLVIERRIALARIASITSTSTSTIWSLLAS
jgi:hypothetical protein